MTCNVTKVGGAGKPGCSLLCTIPAYIPHEWLLRPHYRLWPPQRHRALMWVLSRYVILRSHHHRILTPHDLMDFLQRSKFLLYQLSNRHNRVVNFLTVLDSPFEDNSMWKHTWISNRHCIEMDPTRQEGRGLVSHHCQKIYVHAFTIKRHPLDKRLCNKTNHYVCKLCNSYVLKLISALKKFLWERDFPPVQTGSGAHSASCTMGTGSLTGVEAAGAWGWPSNPPIAKRS